MRKAKRKALKALAASQARCEAKFDTLATAMQEHGYSAVSKLRDRMNHAGTRFEEHKSGFNTSVRGKEKRKGSSKQPMGYPSVNSQFGR